MSFLRAYRVVDNPEFLKAAENAADALIRGQNDLGGWHHTIHVDQPNGHAVSIDDAAGSLVRGQNNPGGWDHTIQLDQPNGNVVSFDDDQTQSAIRLLMALNEVVDKPALGNAVEKSLKLMLQSQLPNGGWPHIYPKQGDYHDFATFNDGGINDCLSVMMDAHQYYGKQAHLDSINNAGWFIMISQLPPPQTGWIQQYNDYLQPAWGRVFEPPAVCPMVTVRNIGTLMDLYLYTGRDRYLEPIPDAIDWLHSCRLPNGKWARFIEIGTGQPLYYDKGRVRVNSTAELSPERSKGYRYESDLSNQLREAEKKFESITELKRDAYLKQRDRKLSQDEILEKLKASQKEVGEVISTQDEAGRWIIKNDPYKIKPGRNWDGRYDIMDRISSKLFNNNVQILCNYIELFQSLKNMNYER